MHLPSLFILLIFNLKKYLFQERRSILCGRSSNKAQKRCNSRSSNIYSETISSFQQKRFLTLTIYFFVCQEFKRARVNWFTCIPAVSTFDRGRKQMINIYAHYTKIVFVQIHYLELPRFIENPDTRRISQSSNWAILGNTLWLFLGLQLNQFFRTKLFYCVFQIFVF